jgi:two-component system cell cycle response regulator
MNILLIEDNPDDVLIISDLLSHGDSQSTYYQETFNIISADSLKTATSLLSKQKFDVIFIDLMLLDSHGAITVRRIYKVAPSDVPIIVLSGYLNKEVSQKTIQYGAQDCLIKGHIDFEIVARSIFYAIERKKADERLKKMAFFDQITGLFNYTYLIMHLDRMLKRAQRYKEKVTILFIDIDHFKCINDAWGHDTGNKALKTVAQLLNKSVRKTDLVARIGGDEFVIVLDNIPSREFIAEFTMKLIKLLHIPRVINKRELLIQASVGISLFPQHGDNASILLKKADQAMYRVKKAGRNNFQFYDFKKDTMT